MTEERKKYWELYPTDTPPDDVLQAAWEQTPAVKLPETEKKKVVAGFLPIHDALPDDTE